MDVWFYAISGERFGPVDETKIKSLIEEGALSHETPIWKKGMAQWATLQQTDFGASLQIPPSLPKGESTQDGAQNVNLSVSGIPERVQVDKNVEFNVGIGKSISLAPISLALAVAGFFTGVMFIPALICGHIALNRCKRNPEEGGRGMALAAVILSYIALSLPIIGLIVYSVFVGTIFGALQFAQQDAARVSQMEAQYSSGIRASGIYEVEKMLNAAVSPEIYDLVVEYQRNGDYQSILPYVDQGKAISLQSGDIVKVVKELPLPERPRLCVVKIDEDGDRYYLRKGWLAANSRSLE